MGEEKAVTTADVTTAEQQIEPATADNDGFAPLGYRRVLLKLGGEMFGGGSVGVDPTVVQGVARQIAEVVTSGVQVAIVIEIGRAHV